MTTLATATPDIPTAVPPTSPHPTGRARRPRSWRWVRFALPLALVLVFWAAAAGAHALESPDLTDPGTMSPTGTGPHGSSRLAELLRDKGITIQTVTTARAALEAADGEAATIFVPTPEFLGPAFTTSLRDLAGDHRAVLVRPGLFTMIGSGHPFFIGSTRFATATVPPSCSASYAREAGPAAVREDTYVTARPDTSCYGGSLIGFVDYLTGAELETVFVGANDPFRNDRIGESGNAALATGLLSGFRRVIWVDVHKPEPFEVNLPRFAIPEYNRGDQNRTSTGNPLIDAFPAALWAVLLLIAAGAALFAVARARRLGPPVPEPLPVLVPAAETVTGRGRLYERIAAREASFAALRTAAVSRMARVLDPFAGAARERELARPGPALDRFVAQVAARVDITESHVRDVLYGQPPTDDAALLAAVQRLDQLVAAVAWRRQPPSDPRGGTP